MAATSLGQAAETATANFLQKNGYKIIARNWKTPVCEIDIIAQKDDAIHFIEIKYRASSNQGSGFEYIGPKKLHRIKFAARVWNQQNNWDGDYRIVGAQVTGAEYESIELVEIE